MCVRAQTGRLLLDRSPQLSELHRLLTGGQENAPDCLMNKSTAISDAVLYACVGKE
jgi:hypothetical protein